MRPSSWVNQKGGALLVMAASALTAANAAGCGPACDTSDEANPAELYTAGTTTDGVYESSRWRHGLLHFPGGKRFDLEHHLGFTPAAVEIYIAFSAEDGMPAPCAGNSCPIPCVDSQIIRIKNDTCAEFWVRVVASERSAHDEGTSCTNGTPPPESPDGSPGDGGAGDDAPPE